MKRSFLPLMLALGSPAPLPAAGDAAISHQIVGQWQWIHAADGCRETYDYRPDGSLLATSGSHEIAATYAVSRRQNAQGFYEISIQPHVRSDAPRCPGNPLSGGTAPYTVYVIFHRTQPLHLLCETPGLERCLGPLRRVRRP